MKHYYPSSMLKELEKTTIHIVISDRDNGIKQEIARRKGLKIRRYLYGGIHKPK